MRLTLRTLLAYLDNTLDPQDAELLRSKLRDSGFATQLVQRIHNVLVNGSLSAPAPDAMGPVEEANVIGEYLDSTLPVEQVAEIERACLESDAHLAEAAACHQILTIVLKKPADIPQELRQRIYELPDRQIEDIAAGGSFSGVSIPPDSPSLQPLVSEMPTSDATAVRQSKPIRPVGPDDSGVSDAPTRLRKAEVGLSAEDGRSSIAPSRHRSVDHDTRIYGGSIRPSRIAPWLVSLGLAAVLFFVLAQLFQPLLNSKVDAVADLPETAAQTSTQESQAAAESETKADASLSVAPSPNTAPSPNGDDETAVAIDAGDKSAVAADTAEVASASPETDSVPDADADAVAADRQVAADADRVAVPPTTPAVSEPETPSAVVPAAAEVAADGGTVGAGNASVPPPPQPEPPMASDVAQEAADVQPTPDDNRKHIEVAKVGAADSLVTALVGDQWIRLKPETAVVDGVKVFCAPTFRAPLTVTGGELTLVGPSRVEWIMEDEDRVTLAFDFGRMLIASAQSDFVLPVQIGDETIQFQFAEPDSVAAVELTYYRAPGFDPLVPENRIPITRVLLVKGTLTIESNGQPQVMQVGQERRRRGSAEPELATLDVIPPWIEPTETPFDASARAGLLELLDGSRPLELQLREATVFRRSEVAALAGRTLVGMGKCDVCFGGDGLFNEPKQRSYWPEHFAAVSAMLDLNDESAAQVHDSIVRMDSANSNPLLRLLNGFSQKQLEGGADGELVQLLDSPSMAVRVLALENLHKITGTTLYFRPDQENAVRREQDIKKWETRLRKGDIRWQE